MTTHRPPDDYSRSATVESLSSFPPMMTFPIAMAQKWKTPGRGVSLEVLTSPVIFSPVPLRRTLDVIHYAGIKSSTNSPGLRCPSLRVLDNLHHSAPVNQMPTSSALSVALLDPKEMRRATYCLYGSRCKLSSAVFQRGGRLIDG